MNVLVVGLGVIGTTYGRLFQKAGHNVEHLLRQGSSKARVKSLQVDVLDGRFDERDVQWTSTYDVKACAGTAFDLIFVSVPSGAIEAVVKDLDAAGISGTAKSSSSLQAFRAKTGRAKLLALFTTT